MLTSAALAGFIGVVVSFALAKFPKVSAWWKTVKYKVEIMAIVFILAPFVIMGASCGGVYFTQYACPPGAFVTLKFYAENIVLGVSAFAGSQFAWENGAEVAQKSK